MPSFIVSNSIKIRQSNKFSENFKMTSSNDNQDDMDINMINFGNSLKFVIESFKMCTEKIKFKDEFMIKHIEAIKKHRISFREFMKDSLKFNDRLEDYSYDILF